MSAESHYVPILKSKLGERWALANLKPMCRRQITPLIELHDKKERGLRSQVGGLCESLAVDWGTDRPFYVDTRWLHKRHGMHPSVNATIELANANKLKILLTVDHSTDAATCKVIRTMARKSDLGCLVRISRSKIKSLGDILEKLEMTPGEIDLLIDYQATPMALNDDIPTIPRLAEWRKLITASGAFLKSMKDLEHDVWHNIPRHDWISWFEADDDALGRVPLYSDYTTRPPGAPSDFGSPNVNIRYTLSRRWSLRLGGKVQEGASADIHDACKSLVRKSYYAGAEYSAGDAEYEAHQIASAGTGNSTQWVAWSVNHHITYVVEQLSRAFEP